MVAIAAAFVALSLIATVIVIDSAEYNGRYPIEVGDTMVYSWYETMSGSEINETINFHVTFVNDTQVELMGSWLEGGEIFFGFGRVPWSRVDSDTPYLQFYRIEVIETPMGPRMVEHSCYSGDLDDSYHFQVEYWYGKSGIPYKWNSNHNGTLWEIELLSSDIWWV